MKKSVVKVLALALLTLAAPAVLAGDLASRAMLSQSMTPQPCPECI